MPLNIKEIYTSDLDPNELGWWSRPKVDKLNHNFNQLIDGGMYGPVGVQGSYGGTGLKGVNGDQGVIGYQGSVGSVGADANLNWKHKDGNDNRTLYPYLEEDDYFGISLVTGVDGGSYEYEDSAVYNQVSQYRLITNNKKQLSLRTGDLKYDFKLVDNTDGYVMVSGNISPTPPTRLHSNNLLSNYNHEYVIPFSSNLHISKTLFSFSGELYLQDSEIDGVLLISKGAAANKILSSNDNTGEVSWRNRSDVLSILPIGSIVSIPLSYFNANNFHIINAGSSKNGILNIYYGRGKENTVFDGWYLANGREWNYSGSNSYSVPNLNSFTYNIGEDTFGSIQTGGSGGDSTDILIAGVKASSLSEFTSGTGSYESTLTIDSVEYEETFDAGSNSSSTHYATKNVHIINLKNPLLSWSTVNTQVPTSSIYLSDPSSSSSIACSFASSPLLYYWTGNSSSWNNINYDTSGVFLFDANNDLAIANKWYSKDGVARYWNGVAFTNVVECTTSTNVSLLFHAEVWELNNGNTLTGVTYVINSGTFSGATTLLINGSPAGEGWYREEGSGGSRRFWTGTSFSGDIISKDFVYGGSSCQFSYLNSAASCFYPDATGMVYYSSDTEISTTAGLLQDIYSVLGTVYVHKNWAVGASGELALVKVYSQNGIGGGTSPYSSIVNVTSPSGIKYRANINTYSSISQPIVCDNYLISGTKTVNNSNSSVSGSILVNTIPALIELSVFGGAGGNACFTEATLTIYNGSTLVYTLGPKFANAYSIVVDSVTIGNITTTIPLSYTLSASFGCNSGNSATIS